MKNISATCISIPLMMLTTLAFGQMHSSVTSLADDEFAHPHDKLLTPEDESTDGICEDSLGRCTLRAALEEASLIELYADVIINVGGTLVMDPLQGSFFPPDHSIVTASPGVDVKITGDPSSVIFVLDNSVTLYGLQLSDALQGIVIGGNNNLIGTVTGNKNFITNMEHVGILIAGDSNRIVGNIIGLDRDFIPDGSQFGIFITGRENVIGGLSPDQGNVISGNDIGIGAYPYQDTFNAFTNIIGNKIGTHPGGTLAIANRVGIDVIGPYVEMRSNVISGNTESGVLAGLDAQVYMYNNFIGTDESGTIEIPNRDGITLGPGSESSVVSGNLIKGNTQFGIFISGLPDSSLFSNDHSIIGNDILENGQAGIGIANNSHNNVIGSSRTDIQPPNIIQRNGQGGIIFSSLFGSPDRNTIRKNAISDNNTKGIIVTPNTQDNIAAPVVVTYTELGGGLAEIVGTHARAGAIIDVYSGVQNASGRYEGFEWLGSGPVDQDHVFQFVVPLCSCDTVVATATDVQGNTSEFSTGTPIMVTGVNDLNEAGVDIMAFPNPFRDHTVLQVELVRSADIVLSIVDVTGRVVCVLCNDRLGAGRHVYNWTPSVEASGVYYYRMSVDGGVVRSGKVAYTN